MTMSKDYKVCGKCGHRHSVLVPHKCFKAKGQDERPEFEDPEEGEGGDDKGGAGGGDGADTGQGKGKGDKGKGKGQGQGQGEAEGEGEGQGQGQGQGEGEGESQSQSGDDDENDDAPKPKPPEPDAPVVAIVCTVLKFAALTARGAKNGLIEVSLSEAGLCVYGQNGDQTGFAIIPWGEFEQRSTLDGEFYVKEIIDQVDGALIEAKAEPAKPVAEQKPKGKKPKAKEAPKPTLPLTIGQRVVCADGFVLEVVKLIADGDWTTARYGDGIVTDAVTGDCDVHGHGGGHSYNAMRDARDDELNGAVTII
jgi:hypothetical protein